MALENYFVVCHKYRNILLKVLHFFTYLFLNINFLFRYSIPSRRDVGRGLEKKFIEMTEKMRKDIKSVEQLAITHDSWTSLNTESYGTVTVHLIDEQWNLKTYVIETKKLDGSHTAEKIADSLRATQTAWGLATPIATTDNAANEKKAFQLLGWERFGCFGHRINLTVRNGLGVPEVSGLLKKARRLVAFFHSSSSCTDELKKKQIDLFPRPDPKSQYKLIMDVCTRWNSTYAMLDRVIDLTPALVALANDNKINKTAMTVVRSNIFSFEEVEIARMVVDLLGNFKAATEILCAESAPTMHKVVPVVLKLQKACEPKDDDHLIVTAMKSKMKAELDKRASFEGIALVACALNPFTKNFDFAPEHKESAMAQLRTAVTGTQLNIKTEPGEPVPEIGLPSTPQLPELPEQFNEQEPNQPEVEIVEPPAKTVKMNKAADFEDWLDDVVFTGKSEVPVEVLAEKELDLYLTNPLPVQGRPTLLEWWRCNEGAYPRLAKLAKRYLCCPASSVPAERVFSLAGQLVNKKRSRLTDTNVDMMICLNKNINSHWK